MLGADSTINKGTTSFHQIPVTLYNPYVHSVTVTLNNYIFSPYRVETVLNLVTNRTAK